jgi:hypothetical protein
MKVYLAQLKCPSNHCVVAAAGEYRTLADAEAALPEVAQQLFEMMIERGEVKRECGLCLSTNLHFHVAATVFANIGEAEPWLKRESENQERTRLMLRAGRN